MPAPIAEPRQQQLRRLAARAEDRVKQLTLELLASIEGLDERVRLPLVDLATPALRELSPSQYEAFRENVTALVEADENLDLFEWVLQRMILHHLEPQFSKAKPARVQYDSLHQLEGPCGVLLSALAHAGHDGPEAARIAFEQGKSRLNLPRLQLLDRQQCNLGDLDEALDVLDTVKFKLKRELLEAGAATILTDQKVTVHEAELLRGIADSLGCPMPPLLPGQPIA